MASNNQNIIPVNGTDKLENGDNGHENLLEVVEEQRNRELSDNQNILPNIEGTNQNNETDESIMPQNLIPEEPDMIFAENSNNDQSEFDTIVGCIEDIVIGEKFQDLQESLIGSNCEEFDENSEENKLIYMDIFQGYTKAVEEFIEEELEKRIPEFNMKSFIQELESRRADLDGEVFDLLFTLTDFLAFKEMMIDYKIMKNSGALDELLSISRL